MFPVLWEAQAEFRKMLAGVWEGYCRAPGSQSKATRSPVRGRALGMRLTTVVPVDFSPIGRPATWISWPGNVHMERSVFPWLFIMSGRRR